MRKKPANELTQAGTYRGDRHESKGTGGAPLLTKLPASPLPLAPGAQAIYKAVGDKLIKAEMLKGTDVETLAQYATEADVYTRCMAEANAGPLVVELHNKVTAPNPYRKLAETALKNMLSLGDRLGLNPRSRYGMKGHSAFSDGDSEKPDPFADFLNN